MDEDVVLRLDCLRLAVQVGAPEPWAILKRAQGYIDFVQGRPQTEEADADQER